MNQFCTSENRFPNIGQQTPGHEDGKFNPAIQLYGRRYIKDQSVVEYLAELLLVFLSPKMEDKSGKETFSIKDGQVGHYYPKTNISLKLFTFFSGSKLETRHPVHQQAYLEALTALKNSIETPESEKDAIVRLLQSLFNGFVGVSKNRTWVAQNFLPISPALVSREVGWRHTEAMRNGITEWEQAEKSFDTGSHMFMARGGEMLFLQLANLFCMDNEDVQAHFTIKDCPLPSQIDIGLLQKDIEERLSKLLSNAVLPLTNITSFVENALQDFTFKDLENRKATLGWIPKSSAPEAFLFALEFNNILMSNLPELEKLDLLQTLCAMQVLRNLCSQAYRTDVSSVKQASQISFVGQYIWVMADPGADPSNTIRKLSENSLVQIEQTLYRVLKPIEQDMVSFLVENHPEKDPKKEVKSNDAQKHGFQIFRKIAKDIGLVIPPKGQGQRFILTPKLIRFLVISLVEPGQQMTLNDFYKKVFTHYGIALGDRQLAKAIEWMEYGKDSPRYAITANTGWIEEFLLQGGFLLELSDAVSIVRNTVGME